MQGSASPRDKRPLFAQGVIYDSPPTSPYGQGESPRQHFAPFSSPGIRSPHSSPRYSTPNYSNYPRPPKFPRDFQGASPRSPWSPQGYSGSPRHQHYSQNRRVCGRSTRVVAFVFLLTANRLGFLIMKCLFLKPMPRLPIVWLSCLFGTVCTAEARLTDAIFVSRIHRRKFFVSAKKSQDATALMYP